MAQENYKTFDFTPYESNFATGRREELADRTKQEFDTNKAEYDILQRTIGSLETTDFNKKYVDKMNTDIEKKMEGVLQTGRYDLAGFGVADSLTRYMTDTTVKNAVESFQMIKKEDQVNAANPNKVHRYYEVPVMLDENQNEWTAADYKDPNKEGVAQLDANDNPVMKDLRQEHDAATGAYAGNSEEALDHVARASTMMQNIASNTVFIENMIQSYKRAGITIDADTAKKFILNGKAITDNQVAGLADELIDEYASTPEGLQRIQALSLKLSPNVEYYGKDPLMQLYSDEEIREILLNDLRGAGQTQIGQTMSTTSIPQNRVGSTDTNVRDRRLDYINSLDKNELVGEITKSYETTKENIAAGTSKLYDANGTLKLQKTKIASSTNIQAQPSPYGGGSVDSDINDPDSFTKAYERATTSLKEQGSNNPLDITDEFQRSVYINTEFDALKKDKKGNPIPVSDAEFTYQIEKTLASAKSIQNTTYLPRTEASQKGGKSGAIQIVENISANLNNKGVLVFDDKLNPNQGLSVDLWDKQMDKELSGLFKWHSVGEAKKYLKKALINTAKGTSKDAEGPDVSVGLTVRPQSPGATQVSYTDESGNSRVIYIKMGELSQTMFKSAAGLIELATNPLTPQVKILPNIYGLLDEKKVNQGIQTFIGSELFSTGGTDSNNNPIPFTITTKYYAFEGKIVNGKPVPTSNYRPVSQERINEFIAIAVQVYSESGPDAATPYKDQEEDF